MNIFIRFFIFSALFLMTLDKAEAAYPSKQGYPSPKSILSRALSSEMSKEIIVAVIDTGVDLSHPALKDSLWTNPGEVGIDKDGHDKSINGIDDDGDGYIDDVHGFDFLNNTGKVVDTNGHGTHISGIIAGKSIPRLISGDLSQIRIMALKYFDESYSEEELMVSTAKAIRYAVDQGAKVINYSSSGRNPSSLEESAIRYAAAKGVIFVTAAGNHSMNLDVFSFYPAKYSLPNIITVAALNEKNELLDTSNYGSGSVQVAAPGKKIKSTLPGNTYGEKTGTSQATAYVSQRMAWNILHEKQERNIASSMNLMQELKLGARQDLKLAGKVRSNLRLN